MGVLAQRVESMEKQADVSFFVVAATVRPVYVGERKGQDGTRGICVHTAAQTLEAKGVFEVICAVEAIAAGRADARASTLCEAAGGGQRWGRCGETMLWCMTIEVLYCSPQKFLVHRRPIGWRLSGCEEEAGGMVTEERRRCQTGDENQSVVEREAAFVLVAAEARLCGARWANEDV